MIQNNKLLLFKAALMLSAIGGSIAVIIYLGAALFYEQSIKKIQSVTSLTSTDGTSPLYFAVFGLFYALSLFGVYRMYNLRKAGFWFYLIAQLVILLTPTFWLGKNSFSMTNTIFTGIFVLIYLSFYKKMR